MNDPSDSRPQQDLPAQADEEPPPPGAVMTAGALHLDIVHACAGGGGGWSALASAEALALQAAGALARHRVCADLLPASAALALGDDGMLCGLNRSFRGIDKPTNVLSFPSNDFAQEVDAGGGVVLFLGDIAIAFETTAREATDQGKPLAAHFQHLVIHGLLHLIGLDHETDDDASEMEAIETEVLATLGIADPYALPPAGRIEVSRAGAADFPEPK